MIVLADSPEQELKALRADARAQALRNNASRWVSEAWEFGALRIRSVHERRMTRGGYATLVALWYVNGHRIGYNALLGEMRKEL